MQRLDAALRPDIRIFTLTLNPVEDTVERLAVRAKERGASGRWRFLTGEAGDVYRLLDRLGVRVGGLDEHPSIAFLAWRGRIYQMNGPLSADDASRAGAHAMNRAHCLLCGVDASPRRQRRRRMILLLRSI